jgi:hypothetical protein
MEIQPVVRENALMFFGQHSACVSLNVYTPDPGKRHSGAISNHEIALTGLKRTPYRSFGFVPFETRAIVLRQMRSEILFGGSALERAGWICRLHHSDRRFTWKEEREASR